MAGWQADASLAHAPTKFEPGDQLCILLDNDDGKLFLPAQMWGQGVRVELPKSISSGATPRFDPFQGCLVLPGLRTALSPNAGQLRAKYAGANTFQLVVEEFAPPEARIAEGFVSEQNNEERWTSFCQIVFASGEFRVLR